MKYAHYFKTADKHILIISESFRPVGETIPIDSKKAAIAYAKANNLTPWNF